MSEESIARMGEPLRDAQVTVQFPPGDQSGVPRSPASSSLGFVKMSFVTMCSCRTARRGQSPVVKYSTTASRFQAVSPRSGPVIDDLSTRLV